MRLGVVYRFIFLYFCLKIQKVEGLQCWKCERATSMELCSNVGRIVSCLSTQDSCVTVVRRYENRTIMWKGCKQTTACETNQNQNREDANPHQNQCNNNLKPSTCTCCCNSNLCNAKEVCEGKHDVPPSTFTRLMSRVLSQRCPNVKRFRNGKMECTSSNNVGSVCNFTCTSNGFTIHPTSEAATSKCLANREWSQPRQCCARPCPPYAPIDLVVLLHVKDEQTWLSVLKTFTRGVLRTYRLGYDALRLARIPFSGVPHLEQAILLNHTNNMAASTFFELAQTQEYRQTGEICVIKFTHYFGNLFPYSVTFGEVRTISHVYRSNQRCVVEGNSRGGSVLSADDGLVNIGAALTYALRVVKGEKRDPNRHLHAVVVLTDSESDDDVVGPAEALRKEGVLTFAQFFRATSTENYNMQELLQIAGVDQRVMVYNEDGSSIPGRQGFNVFQYVCDNICQMYDD